MRLLICGAARCLWDDLAALGPWDGHIMAVNRAGIDLPREPEHWAIGDSRWAQFLVPLRGCAFDVENGYARPRPTYRGRVHSTRRDLYVTDVWDESASGTSSFFAVKIARKLPYSEIVLAGVPMDESGHYYDPPDKSNVYHGMFDHWSRIEGVTSLSGRTRALLGAPC